MSALSRNELLALLEFLPLHHAVDLPDQEPYDHLRTLLIGLEENFADGPDSDELAFFLDVEPADLIGALGSGWSREATRPVRDKSRLWYFSDDHEAPRVAIGVGPEDLLIGTATEHGPELGVDDQIACLPRALTPELIADVDALKHTF